MCCHGFAFRGVAATVVLLSLGAVAAAADLLEPPSVVERRALRGLELWPGMTKIVRPGRAVRSIVVGNPNIVNASAINLDAIAVTGKGIGVTNVILFDENGRPFFNIGMQVVQAEDYQNGPVVDERQAVRVVSLWRGASREKEARPKDRRYLCAQNCAAIEVDEPKEFNPPGSNYSGSSGDRSTVYYPPAGSLGPSAAPIGPSYQVPDRAQ